MHMLLQALTDHQRVLLRAHVWGHRLQRPAEQEGLPALEGVRTVRTCSEPLHPICMHICMLGIWRKPLLSLSNSDLPWLWHRSKLANVLFTYELARRLPLQANVTVNALHPGVVQTELSRSAFCYLATCVLLFVGACLSGKPGGLTRRRTSNRCLGIVHACS